MQRRGFPYRPPSLPALVAGVELLSVPGLCWTWGHTEPAPWSFWTGVPCWVTVPMPPATWGGQCSTAPRAQSWGRCRPPASLSPSRLRCGAALSRPPPGRDPPTPTCLTADPSGEHFPSRAGAKEEGERPPGSPRPRVLFTHLSPSGLLEGRGQAGWDRGCGVPLTSERRPGGWAGLTGGGLGPRGLRSVDSGEEGWAWA